MVYENNVADIYSKGMAEGAKTLMEPQQQPYGYTCGFHDPFGNDWRPVESPEK